MYDCYLSTERESFIAEYYAPALAMKPHTAIITSHFKIRLITRGIGKDTHEIDETTLCVRRIAIIIQYDRRLLNFI